MKNYVLTFWITFFAVFNLFYLKSQAHTNHPHHKNKDKEQLEIEIQPNKYEKINDLYILNVKSIFQRKCFDCHSQNSHLPWYSKLPGVKQLIDKDIKEAKEHLNFSNDFPFYGHGTPMEDLNALETSVKENSMPPIRYKILHWESSLSEKEKAIVLHWIHQSQEILTEK